MIDDAALLGDLQGELGSMVADLGGRVGEVAEVREPLEAEWRTAFDAGRTGRTFEAWLEDRLTQVAVGWLLACVFVRFSEDNGLIDEPLLSGPGDRGAVARAAYQRYFTDNPHHSDREYLHHVFAKAAALPGLAGVVGRDESPLWLVDPPADACTRLLAVFRRTTEAGTLVHDFTDPTWSTRFLGDLYQDLSEFAKSTYALLQTPEFVEEFILDRTLTPALETFGLARTTLIDPTCGSGHFLLGAFDRLWQAWHQAEPATPERELAQRALTQVTGVDLNPFAASIARFRLLVAALKVSAITRLADAPDFQIDIAVGDSLLWGAYNQSMPGLELGAAGGERQFTYATEHAEALQKVFRRHYSAVVGNPPYIIARDKALNAEYRKRYPMACSGKYSLAAPFMQNFFELATQPDGSGRPAGHVGMITANSFMKREFGKKVIEKLIPTWDLTHVVDTSGAYIPGHGTPTVILFGRHQRPVQPVIRIVMGIRGEPSTPADPAKGKVWTAILNQVDEPGSESDYVSVADTDRSRFATHPWSIGGGGAAELKERLDDRSVRALGAEVESVGITSFTLEDDVFLIPADQARRNGLGAVRPMVEGDRIRDYSIGELTLAVFPYNSDLRPEPPGLKEHRRLWRGKACLSNNKMFGGRTKVEAGLNWYEFGRLTANKLRTPLSIAFASVATHNHFVLDRGGKVFKQSAPVIKLAAGASVDDHLALVGWLNSAVACFWMQQVFHNKGASVDAKGARQTTVAWDNFFDHDGTKLQQFPLPSCPAPVELARRLDGLAQELAGQQPGAVAAAGTPTRAALDGARAESDRIFAEMVAAQEELDWYCLHAYGLTDESLTVPDGQEPPPLALGERAFEIVLARRVAAGEVDTAWFTRHRSAPVTELPESWPGWYRDLVQRRIDLIESDRDVALVERPEHKRRWARDPWERAEERALREWLCDRLEDRRLWFEGSGDTERAVCRSVAQLADRVAAVEPAFFDVARLWKGVVEIDPVAVITELVADEHVPAQAGARYKAKGFDKRRQWERTWDLQRMEDRGEELPDGLAKIPVPPKYGSGDFAKTSYWQARGKLDVPKERFTSVAGAERDTDPTLVLAWAGFDHAELAQALATLATERSQHEGWDPDRVWPVVVALVEQLAWLDQWHAEVVAAWGDSPANLYRGMAEQLALAGGRTLADAADWRLPAPTRGRTRRNAS